MQSRKVIGIGETIMDILFRGRQPVASVPGGSCYNSIISIGRMGVPCLFAGYTADDVVGRQIKDFLAENGVGTDFFQLRQEGKSAISLAYLDEKGDADYVFYKFCPTLPDDWQLPPMERDDVVMMGSYFAISQGTRKQIDRMLDVAGDRDVIVYYDLNFRKSHKHELADLLPAIESNMRKSTIVRGSADDFDVMYGTRDPEQIYREHIASHCPIFICTAGGGEVTVYTPKVKAQFPVPKLNDVVSTVGAGDNFNAGLVFSIFSNKVTKDDLATLSEVMWREMLYTACDFASEACRTTNNYVSRDFAKSVLSNNEK